MRKPKFNEKKYNAALQELAKQIAAMAHEDYDCNTENEELFDALEDYAADTMSALRDAVYDAANVGA